MNKMPLQSYTPPSRKDGQDSMQIKKAKGKKGI